MTHRFGDESSASPPPTLGHLGAVLLQLITMVFTASPNPPPPKKNQQPHTTLHQAVVPWFHMPEPVRITAEAPCREGEGSSLFLSITTSVLLTSFYFVTWHCQSWSHSHILKLSQKQIVKNFLKSNAKPWRASNLKSLFWWSFTKLKWEPQR